MFLVQDASSESIDMETSGRVAPPRLEKKKKLVSREKLIKQAESIFDDIGKSKALLGQFYCRISRWLKMNKLVTNIVKLYYNISKK